MHSFTRLIGLNYLLSCTLAFESASLHPPLGFGDSRDIRARFSIKLDLSRPTSLEFGRRKIPTNATWKSSKRKHLRFVTPLHSSLHLVFHWDQNCTALLPHLRRSWIVTRWRHSHQAGHMFRKHHQMDQGKLHRLLRLQTLFSSKLR